ncbi:MAG: alpha-amylase family glycosyl hydrolase [Candidatus Nanopelagicales bacterium]
MRSASRLAGAGAALSVAALLWATAGPAAADPASAGLAGLAAPSVRSPIANDAFYFVMTDRYRDGAPGNDGAVGDRSVTGFDPASDAYYHGGDLAGLTGRCDLADPADDGLARIRRLGFTAVWITPPFVQRTVQGDSAAYHGYWFTDITRPDPHVGTAQEFAGFVDCAHRLGMKVFVDVVVNHTADVISYPQGSAYVPIAKAPYRTAAGRAFDPWSYTSGTRFPALSPTRSFAKTPVVDPGFEAAKAPAVLNQVVRYHNRGDIDWGSCVGRCEMDGDFAGLDDLMTEDWTVVRTLAQAYGAWITDYGIDGFRIDTAKHVDPYFFGRWLPLVQETARAAGKPDFTEFAEAWITDPAQLAELMRARSLPSVLDFGFQDAARQYVTGRATGGSLAAFFAEDDYYTTATTNAYGLTTFLGNHDMGRIGFFLATGTSATGPALLERDLLAHDLLYLTRGVPVVYYGDEVGMTGSGDGTDRNARQDMFSTQVTRWQTEQRIGSGPVGTGSSFDETSPIETHLAALAALRASYPALATGAQITRYGSGPVYVASRIDAADRREYLVAFNTGDAAASVTVPTSTPGSAWTPLLGAPATSSDAAGRAVVSVPPRSSVVLRAAQQLPQPAAPSVRVVARADAITGSYRLTATVPGADPSTVTFAVRRPGGAWTAVGSDDARPFRVYVPAVAGARGRVQVAAVVRDSAGQVATSAPVAATLTPFE